MQLKIVHRTIKKGAENSTSTKVLDPVSGAEVGALVSLSIIGPAPDSFELVIESAAPAAATGTASSAAASASTAKQ